MSIFTVQMAQHGKCDGGTRTDGPVVVVVLGQAVQLLRREQRALPRQVRGHRLPARCLQRQPVLALPIDGPL